MCHASFGENTFLKSLGRPLPSVSASATTPPGATRNVKGDRGIPYTAARALSADEIRSRLVEDFVLAARNAKKVRVRSARVFGFYFIWRKAGFDFVEIHSAHGYLFDQFFCSTTNLRTDEFGCQTLENRTRALGLVLRAVIKEMGGPERVGIRISPTNSSFAYQGCADATPDKTYKGNQCVWCFSHLKAL